MMNNTVFGGEECREALQEAALKLEVGTDWCGGGGICTHWNESEDGQERYKELKIRYEEYNADKHS